MQPQPLSARLSDVSHEVAKNFLSGGARGPAGFADVSAADVGDETPESRRACNPHYPGTHCLQSSRGSRFPPIAGTRRDHSDNLRLASRPPLAAPPPSLGGSRPTVFRLPLPGRSPRLPQAWSKGPRSERKVPSAATASGTPGAEVEPLSALPALPPLPPPPRALALACSARTVRHCAAPEPLSGPAACGQRRPGLSLPPGGGGAGAHMPITLQRANQSGGSRPWPETPLNWLSTREAPPSWRVLGQWERMGGGAKAAAPRSLTNARGAKA